jgi:hypothetical protein
VTTALRRRLSALQNLTEARGATAGEAAAALAAIDRIRDRLRQAGEAIEWPADAELYQDYPQPERPQPRRRARRKASHERPKAHRIKVGDILDCCDSEGTFARCRCGSSTMQVVPGVQGLSVAMLYCLGCSPDRADSSEGISR